MESRPLSKVKVLFWKRILLYKLMFLFIIISVSLKFFAIEEDLRLLISVPRAINSSFVISDTTNPSSTVRQPDQGFSEILYYISFRKKMVSYALSMENELSRGRGRIELILGPMFSGKSTELLRRIRRYKLAKFKCLILKYAGDCRYSTDKVSTHDLQMDAALSCTELEEYRNVALEYEVIGIDEGQFFSDIISFTESLANAGKVLVIAALDGTYRRSAFGEVLNLVPLAESVIKLNAICMNCYNSASFTKRISNEKAVEIIGGAEKYMAVCRECYHLKESIKNDVKRSPLKPLYQNNFN